MSPHSSRRSFLKTALAAAPALAIHSAPSAPDDKPFSFVLLGDLHFDKPEHHDFDWVRQHSPDSVRQSANYSRITRDIHPKLFASVRSLIQEHKNSEAPVAFVLQVGDVVEGLCGNLELSLKQNQEALDFFASSQLGAPILFTKGNHDVTGPGSTEAFARLFHPFLTTERRKIQPGAEDLSSARFSTNVGNAEFHFFDAYDPDSLEWLEAALARRSAEHCFVTIHPPVVPYGARATWHIFSSEKDRTKREKLLSLLAGQRAFVLGGHIHKFNTIARSVGNKGFAQLAVSSVVESADVKAKNILGGVEQYNGDQISVEPSHSPGTEEQRRAIYEAEKAFVKSFAYADLPGYTHVTVTGSKVTARVYAGISNQIWRTVDLSALLALA